MSRDDAYLIDILESARAAIEYMGGRSWNEFSHDHLLQGAIVRRLDIIWDIVKKDLPSLVKKLETIVTSSA